MSTKKLFLLDAFALIYRAYFAFSKNPRINSKGFNTSAIFGFTNTLLEILNKEKPSHIAVVFDAPTTTSREVEYSEYKAHREAMPEDIRASIPYIKEVIEGFNIPILLADGYEADDVIGTIAKKAEKEGYSVYMMSPDKDLGQLIDEHIFLYKPARMGNGVEILGIKEICEKFEINTPMQVADVLGLWGDAVDNIPGVPGIGEKTAKILIKQYGSVENVIQNAHELKGKLQENVKSHAEQALLSKRLATILLDAPVDLDEEALRVKEPNKEKITQLFGELEFRRLAERIFGETVLGDAPIQTEEKKKNSQSTQIDLFATAIEEETVAKNFNTIDNTAHEYELIDTAEKRQNLIQLLLSQTEFCFDTETTGLDTLTSELVGMSFSFEKEKAFYIPVPNDQQEAKEITSAFRPVFETEHIIKIGQNIKYDMAILKNYGIEVKGKLFDTMLAHYLLQPDMRHNMDIMAETYLNYSPVSIETLIGKKGKNQLNMRDVPIEKIKEYAAEDADITYQLKKILQPQLKETGTEKLFEEIEIPLVPVLAAMEAEGVRLDIHVLKEISIELGREIEAIENEIKQIAGRDINIDSPKQLGDLLYLELKVEEKPKKTKTGQYATGEEVLQTLVNKHPIIQKILDYRQLNKLKSTYVDALPELVNKKTERIHTTYNQAIAATGRLSSINPNLQNIPIRTDKGKEIRKAFLARNNDYIILSADYSQVELRIMAALSEDEGMIEAFSQGQDIHAATAAKVYDVALTEVSSDMRRNAKMVNFGIIYGISAFGLAQRLGISRTEAKQIIDQYFEKYPRIKIYMDQNIEKARKQGYVETIMGRRRYLSDINSANAAVRGYAERNAINAPIQGSAADIIKMAMICIHDEMKKKQYQSKMVLQVHDELVFDVYKPELEQIKQLVKKQMTDAIKLRVPLEVELGIGENWLEAH